MKEVIKLFLYLLCIMATFSFVENNTEKTKSIPDISVIHKKENVQQVQKEERFRYGNVSYYGDYWNGKSTANMEIFDSNKLTAASPNLPFNTKVKIINLKNNKSVIVRINDRGPFKMDKSTGKVQKPLQPHPSRVFDLSKAAFDSIGNLDKGVLKVKYKVVGL